MISSGKYSNIICHEPFQFFLIPHIRQLLFELLCIDLLRFCRIIAYNSIFDPVQDLTISGDLLPAVQTLCMIQDENAGTILQALGIQRRIPSIALQQLVRLCGIITGSHTDDQESLPAFWNGAIAPFVDRHPAHTTDLSEFRLAISRVLENFVDSGHPLSLLCLQFRKNILLQLFQAFAPCDLISYLFC